MKKIQLTTKQLEEIARRVSGNNPRFPSVKATPLTVAEALCSTGESLRDILPQHYRDTTISILCGGSLSGTGYVLGAYFNAEDAMAELAKTRQASAERQLSDYPHKFGVVIVSVGHLEDLAVVNPLTQQLFSEIDRLFDYSLLTRSLG